MKKGLLLLFFLLCLFGLIGCAVFDNNPDPDPITVDSENVLEAVSQQIKEVFN